MPRNRLPAICVLTALVVPAWAADAVVSADTYISQPSPQPGPIGGPGPNQNQNFGALGTMSAGPGSYSLIQFDLSALQGLGLIGANIQKATVTLFVNTVTTPGGVDVGLTGQAWTEMGATYQNFNLGLVQVFANDIPVTTAGEYVTFDITTQAKGWLTNAVTNNGLIVKAAAASPATWVWFDTKESTTTSHPAIFNVVLVDSGPRGAGGADRSHRCDGRDRRDGCNRRHRCNRRDGCRWHDGRNRSYRRGWCGRSHRHNWRDRRNGWCGACRSRPAQRVVRGLPARPAQRVVRGLPARPAQRVVRGLPARPAQRVVRGLPALPAPPVQRGR